MPKKLIAELEDFFVNYNRIEKKKFKPLGTIDGKEAKKRVKKSIDEQEEK